VPESLCTSKNWCVFWSLFSLQLTKFSWLESSCSTSLLRVYERQCVFLWEMCAFWQSVIMWRFFGRVLVSWCSQLW
jgi:hypothetical protein